MQKTLFIDRDGTLIIEPPETFQVNSLEEMTFLPGVISALKKFTKAGYRLIIVTNQDALGTEKNPRENYEKINQKFLEIFAGEGITFDHIFECPHTPEDKCDCRKPNPKILGNFLEENQINYQNSYMIGDRESDIEFAKNINIKSEKISPENSWKKITEKILYPKRLTEIVRKTKETDIKISWNLDGNGNAKINTGLKFFDHMLENFAKHGNFDLEVFCQGDLEVDEHHTIEDIALAMGQCLKESLGQKVGITRYAHEKIIPMDESIATTAIDLSGRPYFVFQGTFQREYVGDFPTEMFAHFFRSFCETAGLNLHLKLEGKNTHHLIEVSFKSLARCLKEAVKREGFSMPSTKGIL